MLRCVYVVCVLCCVYVVCVCVLFCVYVVCVLSVVRCVLCVVCCLCMCVYVTTDGESKDVFDFPARNERHQL